MQPKGVSSTNPQESHLWASAAGGIVREEAETRLPRKDVPIVVYDNGEGLVPAARAAFAQLGYGDVRPLPGGPVDEDNSFQVTADETVPLKEWFTLGFVATYGPPAAPLTQSVTLPVRVSVEADARGWPAAYLYRVGDSVTRLLPEDAAGRASILHLKALHPLDDHYGLGCVGAAAGAVAIHNAATVWNKALLDNAARPSGAMVYDPGDGSVMSPEQFERVKREMEVAFSGAANAGRPMLLEGGLDWKAMSLTPAEMDFVGLKAAAAREIALAFGVPPMLMGLPGDNSYANYREANKALWRQTILPLVGKICGGLAQGLQGWWPGLALAVDLAAVPALSDERVALWERVASADFLSADEKRVMLGM